MGYYVNGGGHLKIKKENLDAAYEALMALQDAPAEAKRGGSYSGGKQTASWFSWMPQDLREIPDTASVFERLGFEVEVDKDSGDIVIGYYDNKTGQEDVFFAAAAPFIEDGEYEWTGEDDAFWLWKFEGGRMFVQNGIRQYGEAEELTVGDLTGQMIAQRKSIEEMLSK